MRVVVLIDRYFPILGGAQNNVREMAERLSSKGFNVTVLTRKLYPTMNNLENFNQVTVRRFAYFPFRVVSKLFCFMGILRYLLHHRKEYDVVLCVPCAEFTDLLPAYFAGFVTRKPYVIRMTGSPAFDTTLPDSQASIWAKLLYTLAPLSFWKRVMNRASVVITQSSVLQEMAKKYQVIQSVIIPNGIDLNRFYIGNEKLRANLRPSLGLPENRIIVITTGRYSTEKNQITLIKAVEHVYQTYAIPDKLHLVILGATERMQVMSNEEDLKSYVNQHGRKGFVQFIEDVNNVEDYLRASDIFALPSLTEGMSNSLLEAMSVGLPVVCSDIPQITCTLPKQGNFLFSPMDYLTLAMHLVQLMESSELRKASGDTMSVFVKKNYSNERLVEQYTCLFRGLIAT